MKFLYRILFFLTLFFSFTTLLAQDDVPQFNWQTGSKKTGDGRYEIIFTTPGAGGWRLYAPAQVLSDVAMAQVVFNDSAFQPLGAFTDSGKVVKEQSPIFETEVGLIDGATAWRQPITIKGTVPAQLSGKLLFAYGKGEAFYQGEVPFTVSLEGGVAANTRIFIPAIDVKNPVVACGDEDTQDKGLGSIFFLGFLGGLIALVTPCVFPLIPLTVSFFYQAIGHTL